MSSKGTSLFEMELHKIRPYKAMQAASRFKVTLGPLPTHRASAVPGSVLLAGRPWVASKGQGRRAPRAASGPVQPEPVEPEPAPPPPPGLSLGWGEDRQPRLYGFTFEDVCKWRRLD